MENILNLESRNDPYSAGYGLRFPRSPIISAFTRSLEYFEREAPLKILDIGCGLGAVAYIGDAVNITYVGIDPSEFAIVRAREIWASKASQRRIEFINTSLEQFADTNQEKFDFVIDGASLQHIDCNTYPSASTPIEDVHKLLVSERDKSGYLITLWASNESDGTKNFPYFRGFENVKTEIKNNFLQLYLEEISTKPLFPTGKNSREYLFVGTAR